MNNNTTVPTAETTVDLSQENTSSTPVPETGTSTVSQIPEGTVSTHTEDTVNEDGLTEHVVTAADVALNPGEGLVEGETIYLPEQEADFIETVPEHVVVDSVPTPVQEVEPEVKDLIARKEGYTVKVYKAEDRDYWEVFLLHPSSMPTHQTCETLRVILNDRATSTEGQEMYGYNAYIRGTKEEVMTRINSL